jgi:hypothetical protein
MSFVFHDSISSGQRATRADRALQGKIWPEAAAWNRPFRAAVVVFSERVRFQIGSSLDEKPVRAGAMSVLSPACSNI